MKAHEKFHSSNGKRLILVADDEEINRSILGEYLKTEYEVIFAADGAETLDLIRINKDTLSLVLLDILMPVMSGLEVLRTIKSDPDLTKIPVIVVTSEQKAEVESLNLGAIDFIPKPYPAVDVVQARVLRVIELSEDRQIIASTERDALTGLYNKEFFFRYAEQYDQYHKDKEMDACILDINHFHMINERYGKAYGDTVLQHIGTKILEILGESEGLACRREADTFLIYCLHRKDYQRMLEKASEGFSDSNEQVNNRIRIRMGIYANVDKTIDIERRFDRAKMAADLVQGSFAKTIGYYDDTLHERHLYEEQLIEDFNNAVSEKQFKVFYQPKFDIRPETPVLSSAEALVRWDHPKLGMISPGIFIPLFENNGLIRQLDHYVWKEAAYQIKDWQDRLGYHVPVSVNVSRVDMYDPELINNLDAIVRENGLEYDDLMLEVTESAYTQDQEQIIETAVSLRKLGFKIEMDDFGTGYSSLNVITSLPIDAMKLDMKFVQSAFKDEVDTHMLELIIGIADHLSVPVIAEGVETEEQLDVLKKMKCDLVQGYFFSKPVPAAEFEAFILQKKESDKNINAREETVQSSNELIKAAVLRPDTEPDDPAEKEEPAAEIKDGQHNEKTRSGMHLRTTSFFFVIISFVAALALFIADISVTNGYQSMRAASDRYIDAQMAAAELETGSDYLTERVRCFVVTGEMEYLNDFFEEVEITKRRDKAVERLEELLGKHEHSAIENLNSALRLSNELIETEYLAMRLTLESGNYNMSEVPEVLADMELNEELKQLSNEELKEKAQELVFDNNYMHYKDRIRERVNLCTQELIFSSSKELEEASASMAVLTNLQTLITVIFLLIVLAMVLVISTQIRKPLSNMVELMRKQKEIEPVGAEELRFVTRTYNLILKENREVRERLSHQASHDALTGLFNRGAYDLLMDSVDTSHMALILIDVDYFKNINDTYGHAVGDRILKRVADILHNSFRSVDIICRLGGDEFAVVMTRVNSSMKDLVVNKLNKANELLQHPQDDLPSVSLSVGVAFSDRKNPKGDIFKDADTALYRSKEAGRSRCSVY